MAHRLITALALGTLLAACSSSDKAPPPPAPGGTGGDTSPGGSGGSAGGGTGGFGAGGASGSGGAGGAPSGGSGGGGTGGATPGGDVDAGPSGGTGGTPADGGPSAMPPAGPGEMLGWYEAEAVPPNTLAGQAKVGTCGAGTCPAGMPIKEGMECCSGGKKVSQVIRGTGKLTINNISAPADGMYDVTWWFHCGKNDNFGDANCGGVPHTKSGCRPHVIIVNGTRLPKIYEFPCFPGSWGEIHASTVQVPLKAGAMNSIQIFATPGRDASDMDAIAVYPAGKGTPPIAGSH